MISISIILTNVILYKLNFKSNKYLKIFNIHEILEIINNKIKNKIKNK